MSKRTIQIGLCGLGTVGQGVWRHFNRMREELEGRLGTKVVLARASVRDLKKARGVKVAASKLTTDPLSIENGAIMNNASRWSLMIDPQLQGIRWIMTREEPHGLVIIQQSQHKYIDKVGPDEPSVQHPHNCTSALVNTKQAAHPSTFSAISCGVG